MNVDSGKHPCAFGSLNSLHDAPYSPCAACGHAHHPLEGYCVRCRLERLEARLDAQGKL